MTVKYAGIGIAVFIICCLYSSDSTHLDWNANSKKYGEACVDHDQCLDFRMICSGSNFVCECDQFHDWIELDAYTSECVPNVQRLRSFLSENHETKGVQEEVSEEAHSLFVYLGLSGIIIVSVGVLLAVACIIFVLS
uniref:EB domain-containing protein n=1 Tax=Graphocephala atropunctata TaxID=36148 RepID=A0A1B6LFL1_9HEMI